MDIYSGSSPELIVCQALNAATDGNPETVRKAEAQLNEWETQPGFFATLARIATAGSSPTHSQTPVVNVNVRWMAAVYMKNAVNKFWRRGSRHEIPSEEKQQIRDILLGQFAGEEVPQVALQVAVMLGRIARIDCPRDWPQLMPELLKRLQDFMSALNSAKPINAQEQKCVLMAMHHVVKALASRRMMAEKRIFEELSANIFSFVLDMWNTYTNLFFHQLKVAPAEAMSTLERSLLMLRTLRKLCIFGFAKPHKSESCMSFLQQIFTCLKQCLQCRFELRSLNVDDQLLALLEKFIIKQMKTLLEFQEIHSSSYSRFVPASLEFSFNYIFHEGTSLIFSDNVINFNAFGMHCVNLMRGIMMCQAYTVASNSCPEEEQCQEPAAALSDFFTDDRMCYICEKIVTHYFILTQTELETWAEDPEGFAQDDGGESWKYSLRPSVERLYFACFTYKPKKVLEEVSKYVHKAQQIELHADSSLKDILLKDAIYTAAGLASFQFYHEIDFNSWFSKQLLNELRIEVDSFRILRRRIIWLVGEWAAVKFSRDLRPLAYEACLHLLRPVEDMSIRLAASRTLSTLIGDFEFLPNAFIPYLEQAFNALFVLLREAKECETKMNVLNIMGLLVENMGDHIEPLAEGLIAYLPALWKESEEYSMLRCAIICTLQQLVKAMYDIRDTMKSFLYNVIEHSTNVQEPAHIYLMEEGLQLWVAVIENSSALTPPLFEMCKNLMPIIELSSENLRTVLLLIEGYILLDAHVYLERYGQQFVNFCKSMFDDIRPEGIIMMLKVFETILKSDPNYGLELVRPALPYIFKEVYDNKIFPVQMSMHLMIVARVLLINQSVFMSILQELQEPDALQTILDVWVSKMPLVTELEKRKLFCISFASIFSNNPLLIELFPVIMQRISEAMEEIMREEESCTDEDEAEDQCQQKESRSANVKFCDSLVFVDERDLSTSSYSTMEDFEHKTFHYDRFRMLMLKDPVHQIVLPDYLSWQLQTLRGQLGNEAYQQVMQSVYIGTLEKLSRFMTLDIQMPPADIALQ